MNVLIGSLALLVLAVGIRFPAQSKNATWVTIIQPIETPERFDGKWVSTAGFVYFGCETAFILHYSEDDRHALTENAIWDQPGEWMPKEFDLLNKKYVNPVGIFKASRTGAYPCPNGGFATVKRFSVWSSLDKTTGILHDDPMNFPK